MKSNVYDRILITGGAGMLAQALSRALRLRGHLPVLLDRAALDITAPDPVEAAFSKHRPTLVLNAAAYTKVDLCEEQPSLAMSVNGEGSHNLGYHALLHGAKLAHFSTDFVFDGSADRPYRAEESVNPLSTYGRSKLTGEQKLQTLGRLNYLIIRTAWLYGPGGRNFVQTMLNVARAGKPLRVVDDQIGAPTFTHDLAEATLELIDRDARGIWHVTNAGQTSWFGFAQAIFDEFGVQADLQPTTSAEWKKNKPNSATRPAYSVLDIEPYAKLTGTPMRHWREALRKYRQIVEPNE
jgi:dTDP-4-dehydrorhamnose reductase